MVNRLTADEITVLIEAAQHMNDFSHEIISEISWRLDCWKDAWDIAAQGPSGDITPLTTHYVDWDNGWGKVYMDLRQQIVGKESPRQGQMSERAKEVIELVDLHVKANIINQRESVVDILGGLQTLPQPTPHTIQLIKELNALYAKIDQEMQRVNLHIRLASHHVDSDMEDDAQLVLSDPRGVCMDINYLILFHDIIERIEQSEEGVIDDELEANALEDLMNQASSAWHKLSGKPQYVWPTHTSDTRH